MPGQSLLTVASPYDGKPVGQVPVQTPQDVGAAVERARCAVRSIPHAHRRATVLDRAAELLHDDREEMARTIASESAKPVTTARQEVDRAVEVLRFSAAVARTHTGQTLALDASRFGCGKVGFTRRVPIGVIGAITPFNFPLNLVVHKVAPAIAVGCPIVVKPAATTPLTALRLRRLLVEDAGLDPDRFQVVCGRGATVGAALVEHPDVAMITFTGSPGVGWDLRARATRKRVSLELGNNAPLIVAADADWEAAAHAVRSGGFANAGQSCISTQRILVHRSLHDRFVERLCEHVESLRLGDPLDDQVDMSALITPAETDRVQAWVNEALHEGASLVTGNQRVGTILSPTVVTDVCADMRISRDEVFGPVVAISRFDDIECALDAANATRYGLQAGIFTRDVSLALHAADRLNFGGVLINEVPTWRADQQPYGGRGDSGNTREGPSYSADEMTEVKTVILSSPGTSATPSPALGTGSDHAGTAR